MKRKVISKAVGGTYPSRPSNRKLYEKMCQWGWVDETRRGVLRHMTWPPTGMKIIIYGPTEDGMNPAGTFRDVVAVTTNNNPYKFWNEAPGQVFLAEPDPTPAPVVAPQPTEEEEPMSVLAFAQPEPKQRARGGPQNGITAKIIDYVESLDNKTVTAQQVAEAIGGGYTAAQVHSAFYNFVGQGRAIRVGPKTFVWVGGKTKAERDRDLKRAALRRARPLSKGRRKVKKAAPARPASRPYQTVPSVMEAYLADAEAAQAALVTKSDDQGNIDTLLDLLLPGGFKAKDLPAIREWTKATEALLEQVNG